MTAVVKCPTCGANVVSGEPECPECGQALIAAADRTYVKKRFSDAEPQAFSSRTLDSDAEELLGGRHEVSTRPFSPVPPASPDDQTLPFNSDKLKGTLVDSSGGFTPVSGFAELPPPAPSAPARRSGNAPRTNTGERQFFAPERPLSLSLSAPAPQARKDPLIGVRLGEYVVEERIGIGGMGIVYRAVQPMIGNSVAIKVLRPDVIADARDMERLLDEARAVNGIRHRSIISIFGAGQTEDGRQYLVMEFLEGESLEALLAREGKLAVAQVLPILEDVLSALAAAHAAKIVHRDLKPANVFLVEQTDGLPWVKLLDFGLARKANREDVSRIAGTPDYISPEHARGRSPGPPADLYAFGVMTFQLLTGQLPFTGNSPMEVMEKHVHAPPPVPAEVDSSIPPAMSELLLRLLDKDPANRPDAATVRADLRAAAKQLRQASTQVGLAPVPPGGPSTSPMPRVKVEPPQSSTDNGPSLAARSSPSSQEIDPRLQRLAMAADRSRVRSGLAQHWPWLVGGVALLWLLAVGAYLMISPRRVAVPMKYGDEDEAHQAPVVPRPEQPGPDPEPEPLPEVPPTPGASPDPTPPTEAVSPPEVAPAPPVEPAQPRPSHPGWAPDLQQRAETLASAVGATGTEDQRKKLKRLDDLLHKPKPSRQEVKEFKALLTGLEAQLKPKP